MKTTLVLLALAACLALAASHAISPALKEKMKKAREACIKDFPIQKELAKKVFRREALPETENDKCYYACFMKNVEIITDGKFNVAVVKKLNKEKYAPEEVEKANQVADKCDTKVDKDLKECQLAYELLRCVQEEGKAVNLPIPEYS